jgi:hypothetical protein
MNYSLSDEDLLKLIPDGKVVKYSDLYKYKTIDDLVDKPCFILFETTQRNRGHWCCMFKEGDTVYFFDSYGYDIEDQKKYVNKNMLIHTNYISQLLKKCNYKIDYNATKYQGKTSATCGRHCAIRIACRNLNDKEYNHFMDMKCKQYGCTPDQMIVGMTLKHLGK